MAFDITFTNSEGIVVNLNDQVNTFALVGISNDLMPFFDFQEHTSPMIPGSIVTAVRVQPRDFSLPILISDSNRDTALARTRQMLKLLNPILGDGTLKVVNGNIVRVLTCRYRDGITSDGTGDQQFTNYVKAVLTFRAADPFFYSQNQQQLIGTQVTTLENFFPILPVRLSTSSNIVNAVLNNAGDVDAWPVIVVDGPATNIYIENATTGKHIEIATGLNADEKLTIDTRPRTRSIRDNLGVNRFSAITPQSSMWSLKKGANTVSIQITGGDQNSRVTITYTPAFLTV
jgi:phage-related protein